jgi:hypothetical protein
MLYAGRKTRYGGARKEPHPGRRKALSVPFKVGSEILPVRSGAAKLLRCALNVRHGRRELGLNLIIRVTAKLFLCSLKLEVNLFQ